MPGPPPKPGARKPNNGRDNNPFHSATVLPSEGRKAPAPNWPLGKPNVAEAKVWADVWSTPQAVAWERLGMVRTVARYCRVLVDAEKREAAPALLNECRQLEDRLGMSPMAMLRLRWSVAPDEVAEQRETRPQRRLVVPDPAAAAG